MKLLTKIKRLLNIEIKTYENETFKDEVMKFENSVEFIHCTFENCKITSKFYFTFRYCKLIDCIIEPGLSGADVMQSRVYIYNSYNLDLRSCVGTLNDCSELCLTHSRFNAINCKFVKVRYSEINALNSTAKYVSYSNCSDELIPEAYPTACPLKGEFTAYKWVEGYIIKLLIPEDAKRSSAFGFKCRASYAKVLDIYEPKQKQLHLDKIINTNRHLTKYEVGKFVYPDKFDVNRFAECSNGIHFFLNEEDAINYGKGLI